MGHSSVMRNQIALCFVLMLSAGVQAQVHLALDEQGWRGIKAHEVKGRHGILIKQKLSFGAYFTTHVDRSWTKGFSSFQGSGVEKYQSIISKEYIERNQTLFFAFEDSSRLKADVHCVNDFKESDLQIRGAAFSLSNITGRKTSGDASTNLYYVQIYTSAQEPPWHLVIDLEMAQRSPATYTTRLARSANEYYVFSPYRRVKNNKGKVVDFTFGFAGFQVKNKTGESLAAVSLVNKGVVYLKDITKEEKFLLAAACAALLLQEQISTD
jgi:hypothetical protein